MTYPLEKTALILVDPFNDFLSDGGKLWPFVKQTVETIGLLANLKKLLAAARTQKIQVIYAPHRRTQQADYRNWKFLSPSQRGSKENELFAPGTWGGEFHPGLLPIEGDLIAQNHWTASGFANTDLDLLLKMHGKEYIVIAGMRANTCIDSTARYGVELGYHVTLIRDGIAAFTMEEVRAVTEITFPNYGHQLSTTQEFITNIYA